MDASAERWYFSPVTRASRAGSDAVRPAVAFHRTKYGRELLVDAAFVQQMPTFRGSGAPPHTLAFHDIVLVTRGRGRFILDGKSVPGRLALEGRRRLVSSDLTVAQVADRLGFADPAYFARFFRRETGRPPAAFRKAG